MIKDSIEISDIKNGMTLSLENANELIADAFILLDNNRYSRAHCLAQLALEESGKALMLYELYNSLQMDLRKSFDFKKFKKNFRDHKWKTFESNTIDFMMYADNKSIPFEEFAKKNFAEIQKMKTGFYDMLKNDALYVTIKDETFVKPSQLFKEEETKIFLDQTKVKIEFVTNWINKWLEMDKWFGVDKEGIIHKLKK